jgi:hypothetical protein
VTEAGVRVIRQSGYLKIANACCRRAKYPPRRLAGVVAERHGVLSVITLKFVDRRNIHALVTDSVTLSTVMPIVRF